MLTRRYMFTKIPCSPRNHSVSTQQQGSQVCQLSAGHTCAHTPLLLCNSMHAFQQKPAFCPAQVLGNHKLKALAALSCWME